MQRLGDYYREKVLSLKKRQLREQELPNADGDTVIEKGLFGWKLIRGNRSLEFDREEEARYCKVFMEAGVNEIMIPKDLEYLKTILPKLEELKAKHDRIIENRMRGVFSPKIRNEVLGRVWDRMMWEPSPKLKKETKDHEKTVRD